MTEPDGVREYDIAAIHGRLLEIMKKFHRICEENHIIYYMHDGTLLGAIRHKGFIPWDDDIDVAVPRKDYDRLLRLPQRVWSDLDLELGSYKTDSDYRHKFAKVYDKNSTLVYGEGKNIKGLFLDVFPLDGISSIGFAAAIHLKLIAHRKKVLWYSYGYKNQNRKYFFRRRALAHPSTHWHEKLNKTLRRVPFDKRRHGGLLIGLYGEKEIMETAVWGTPRLYEFEDGHFYGPQEAERYLMHVYGDWKSLPPEESRVAKHILGDAMYLNLNLPYEEYLKRPEVRKVISERD